jgi:hypothetical protein
MQRGSCGRANPKEATLGGTKEEARARAEREFKKQQKADDATAEFKAGRANAGRALDEKTSRLKSLRLAKEAAEPAAVPKKPRRASGRKR